MSPALELVKIALRAYGAGDPEITVQLCDPLIRWDERASRPDGDLLRGQDEVLRAMRSYQDGWERYRFEVEKIAEVGSGKIVGLCRERGVEKDGDGIAVDRRYGGLWVVEASKLVAWATYATPAEAVRAAREPAPAAKPPIPPEPEGEMRVLKRPAKEQGSGALSEERRLAAKRRAALTRATRDGAHRAKTA